MMPNDPNASPGTPPAPPPDPEQKDPVLQDLYTSFGSDLRRALRSRDPQEKFDAAIAASEFALNLCTEIEDFTDDEIDQLEFVEEKLSGIKVDRIQQSSHGDFNLEGSQVVELRSARPGGPIDYVPREKFETGYAISSRQDFLDAYFRVLPILQFLVHILKKHGILPWKDSLGGFF